VAIRQDFTGAFSGRALLIFPEASSLELVRVVVGRQLSLEDIVNLEDEALAETEISFSIVGSRRSLTCSKAV